jgi:ech hydrogenase subunit D
MNEDQELILVNKDSLLAKIYSYSAEGYRLVQIHCSVVDEGLELNYSFDKDCHFVNLRMIIDKEDEISSISGIYWSAFLYENEMADLYGVKIKNMAIDYQGNMFQSSVKAPFTAVKKNETDKKE